MKKVKELRAADSKDSVKYADTKTASRDSSFDFINNNYRAFITLEPRITTEAASPLENEKWQLNFTCGDIVKGFIVIENEAKVFLTFWLALPGSAARLHTLGVLEHHFSVDDALDRVKSFVKRYVAALVTPSIEVR